MNANDAENIDSGCEGGGVEADGAADGRSNSCGDNRGIGGAKNNDVFGGRVE